MKNICILLLSLILITSTVHAQQTLERKNKLPQGVFKKQRNGQIIQYDNNGKKIGIYKIKNRKYVRVK